VLICAAVPVAGIDIMTERRSTDPSASRDIRNRAKGFEKHLCKEPCNVGKALGLYEALDGASLFKPPFCLYRPIDPVMTLLNGPRANNAKGADLLWRWGHADYKEWLSPPPFPKDAK
jgi:3-methyladenine DNA glycosylase Mpg